MFIEIYMKFFACSIFGSESIYINVKYEIVHIHTMPAAQIGIIKHYIK